jgi:hypothetical protein
LVSLLRSLENRVVSVKALSGLIRLVSRFCGHPLDAAAVAPLLVAAARAVETSEVFAANPARGGSSAYGGQGGYSPYGAAARPGLTGIGIGSLLSAMDFAPALTEAVARGGKALALKNRIDELAELIKEVDVAIAPPPPEPPSSWKWELLVSLAAALCQQVASQASPTRRNLRLALRLARCLSIPSANIGGRSDPGYLSVLAAKVNALPLDALVPLLQEEVFILLSSFCFSWGWNS